MVAQRSDVFVYNMTDARRRDASTKSHFKTAVQLPFTQTFSSILHSSLILRHDYKANFSKFQGRRWMQHPNRW